MAGVPVYSQQGRNGGWQLIGGARTDLSGLTSDEARALFLVAGPASRGDAPGAAGAAKAGAGPARAVPRRKPRPPPPPWSSTRPSGEDDGSSDLPHPTSIRSNERSSRVSRSACPTSRETGNRPSG